MGTQTKNLTKRLSIWLVVVASILMVPYLGKAPWTQSDFIFAGFVLFGFAALYEIVTRNMKSKAHKITVALAVVVVLFLIWAWAVA